MGLFDSTSKPLVQRVQREGRSRAEWMRDLLDVARQCRPGDGYDAYSARMAEWYVGNHERLTRTALRDRFPSQADRMPLVALNVTRKVAVEDAQAYDTPPERWLTFDGVGAKERAKMAKAPAGPVLVVDEAGDDPDAHLEEREDAFARLLKRTKFNDVMAEAETRLMAVPTVIMRATWDRLREVTRGEGRVRWDLFWPHEVLVVTHPEAPTDIQAALAVLISVSRPVDDGGTWFEVWYRSGNGLDEPFGPWRAEMVRADGEASVPLFDDGEYPLPTLPIVVMVDGWASGSPFVDEGRDLETVQKAVNVGWSNLLHTVDYSAFPQRWVSLGAGATEHAKMVTAPGALWNLGKGGTVGQLSSDVPSAAQDVIGEVLGHLAVTRQQSPGAYSTEPGAPLSGISRRIQNLPQERAQLRRRAAYRAVEEEELLPITVEISDYWGGTTIAHAARTGTSTAAAARDASVGYRVEFGAVEVYEEPEARARRAKQAYDDGLISHAQYGVEAGYYDTVEDAVEAGLSDELKPPASALPAAPSLSSFSAALAARPPPRLVEEPEEADGEVA